MSDFLTEVKGFTPVIEVMVQEVGLVQAAVYGVVWRYCQRRDGVCTASHGTIAEALGLARGTVQRHIGELCEAGYLRDTTPDRKNRPHIYADTGRAQIIGLVSAKVTVSGNDSTVSEKYSPLYQKDTRREYDSIEESIPADAETSTPSEQGKPAPKQKAAKPPAANLYPLARALSEVCSIDLEANKGKLFAEAKRLSKATPPPTYDLIAEHYRRGGAWYTQDWRGKRGDRPQLGQVRLTWAQIVREGSADIQGLDAPGVVPVI